MSIILSALLLLADAPQTQSTPAPTNAEPAAKKTKKVQKICKTLDDGTGSRMSKRICKTREEWDGGPASEELESKSKNY